MSGEKSVLTFFSIPKGFEGHTGIIQRNAISSWREVPGAEVILFGDEDGLSEVAIELGVGHEPAIRRSRLGTPLVSDAFDRARRIAKTPLLAYVNADIMFTPVIAEAASYLAVSGPGTWLAVGRRTDLDVDALWRFDGGWARRLELDADARGTLHGPSGIDYCVFPRTLPVVFPPLAVGRPGWDNWFLSEVRSMGLPLLDLTRVVLCVHQNHESRYRAGDIEGDENVRRAGGEYNLATIRSATARLVRPRSGGYALRRSVGGILMFLPPVRALLALKRRLARRLLRGA